MIYKLGIMHENISMNIKIIMKLNKVVESGKDHKMNIGNWIENEHQEFLIELKNEQVIEKIEAEAKIQNTSDIKNHAHQHV